MPETISGEEFERAVNRSTWSRIAIAKALGVHRSHLYNLFRDGVTTPATVAKVRAEMGLWLDHDPYGPYSDTDLLRELGRRLAGARADDTQPEQSDGAGGSEPADSQGAVVHGDGLGRYTGTGRGPSEDAASVTISGEHNDDDDEAHPRL